MADNFIMILPSDACIDIYPTNTVARYRVNIPARLNFEEHWVVALQSIVHPKAIVQSALTEESSTTISDPVNEFPASPPAVVQNRIPDNSGDHMWIYSDCVEPLLVGDHYHSVLAICPFSSQGIYTPNNLLYVPVLQGDRQSISVWCANHLGQPYPFEKAGRLIAVLHFKRAS